MFKDDYLAVEDLLQRYLDGLYNGDTEMLAGVFHPKATYATASQTPLLQLGMEEYFKIVNSREVPAERGDRRDGEKILSIEFGAQDLAFAKVACAFLDRRFMDFLTLVREDGRWQVISKVFHYDIDKTND